MKKVGFIGAGKVGTTLGKYFFCGMDEYKLLGYYSRSEDSSYQSSKITGSEVFFDMESLVEKSDILFICTPDDSIRSISIELSGLNIQNKIICHTSGSLSSAIFFDISSKGAYFCSLHPVKAISSKNDSYLDMDDTFFTIEGDNKAVKEMENILISKGNPYKIMETLDKEKYHIASVFMSNFVLALGEISVELLSEYGFSEEESLKSLSNLAIKNLENLIKNGVQKSLTGPIERCDISTIENHIKSIDEKKYDLTRDIYIDISKKLVEIAKIKHQDRDYTKIEEILEKRS